MTATYSDQANGFNGTATAYDGPEADSKAEVAKDRLNFLTLTKNGSLPRRQIGIQTKEKAPVQGMTYDVPVDAVGGDLMTIQELTPAFKAYTWTCVGKLTYDAIAGKVHDISFTGDCASGSGGAIGDVKVAGKGICTLP
jgi:hypothetical protein